MLEIDIHSSIVRKFYQVGRHFRQLGDTGFGVENLTLHQMQVLFFIKRAQPVKMSDLAGELHVSAGSASVLVDRLIESGWLRRAYDKSDRRVVYVELTDTAKSKLGKIVQRKIKDMGYMLKGLTPEDLQELDRILTLLVQNSTSKH